MARIVGMPGPTAGSAGPVGKARTLAQVYRRFGEVEAAGTSPLYERVAVALSESGEALRAIEAAPARKRRPEVILAALHDLALAGRAPALAAAYAAADGDAAAGAAIEVLLRMTDSVVAIAVRRQTRTNETGRCAVLDPAIAEAVHRRGRSRRIRPGRPGPHSEPTTRPGHPPTPSSRPPCHTRTASMKRQPGGRWRGCQQRGSESRRRYRHWATAAPLATASSAWR